MGLFDSLSGAVTSALGQAEAAAMPALISAVLAKTDMGNMQGLLDKLQQSGLGPQVSSSLNGGKNLPVSADQLRSALGNTQVQQLATSFGLPIDKVLASLAEHLPAVVDQMSSNGILQQPK